MCYQIRKYNVHAAARRVIIISPVAQKAEKMRWVCLRVQINTSRAAFLKQRPQEEGGHGPELEPAIKAKSCALPFTVQLHGQLSSGGRRRCTMINHQTLPFSSRILAQQRALLLMYYTRLFSASPLTKSPVRPTDRRLKSPIASLSKSPGETFIKRRAPRSIPLSK